MVDWSRRLWPAGVAAFVLHGLAIATLALGMNYRPGAKQGAPKQAFVVEMAFIPVVDSGTDACQEQATKVFGSSQDKQRGKDLTLARPSSPLKKMVAKKSLARSALLPSHTQKNLQQSVMVDGEALPLYSPPPVYPREARRKKTQGMVWARLSITALGRVGKITILSPRADPALEEAVLQTLPQWRFTSRERVLDIPFEFRLD